VNPTEIKSVVRSLRKELKQSMPLRARFEQGRRVAVLTNSWLESGHPDLQAFLMANGCGFHEASRLAEGGEMYQAFPHWLFWSKLGFSYLRNLRNLPPEERADYLADAGFDAVTLLGMTVEA